MFIFCGLYSKAKQDEGKAGTLHVVVVEGNYVALGEPSAKSFMSPPPPLPSPADVRFCRSSTSCS